MRKLIIMTALAVSALAALAPAGFAETEAPATQEPVTVRSEPGNVLCGNVTVANDVASGGCVIHAVSTNAAGASSTVDAVAHTIFGESVVARCLNEFTGSANGAGEGWIGQSQVVFTNPASGGIDCTGDTRVRACTEAEANALGSGHNGNWHLRVVEDHTNGSLWMQASICLAQLNPFNTALGGDVWVSLNGTHPTRASSADHRLTNVESPVPGTDAEFNGGWSIETGGTNETRVEIVH